MVQYVGEPDKETTLPATLFARAEATPDAPFVTFEGRTSTYGDQASSAAQAAAALAALDVGRGDKVALMMGNSLEFLDLWFGISLLGAVMVPVNTALKGDGLRYILEHSGAGVVVVDGAFVDAVEAALPADGDSSRRIVRGADAPSGYDRLDELLDGEYSPETLARVNPGDLASILYTSGTTGLPKGVMNSHNSYGVAANEFTRRCVQMRDDDILYTSLPLFHVNAQSLTTCGSLVSGRPFVLSPRFSASGFFDDLRVHGATVFNYIGAMLTMLFKQPARPEDADNPARITLGGAAPAEIWRAFEARFQLTILEAFGLTETATLCLANPPDDIRVGRVGKPVGWSEVRIEREDGTEAPDGEAGEIAVRSRRENTMFMGYFRNEDATSAAMKGGWFHSGDRGRRDADGYFEFIDRLKDSIRRRGENISSFEIEQIVNSHSHVAESAAVGVPSDLGEEDVMVVVVEKEGHSVDPEELIRFCEERMADFMVPRYVQLRGALPKTATQRIQKYQLRESGVKGAWDRSVSGP
jgi:crotonobetaine/carnitine-CoA ligase